MERLTFKLGESNPSYGLKDKNASKVGLFTDYDGFFAHLQATHKLGQYEDTGLTPNEICDGQMLTGWIPVEEALPKESGSVLTYLDSTSTMVLNYSDKHKAFNSFDSEKTPSSKIDGVTHWMPLPQPPKEENR